ncbi:MAG: reverse transcriptase family protein [Candidatus Omnitrophota bacterium]
MKYSKESDIELDKKVFPILSINKLAWLIEIPTQKLKVLANKAESYYSPFEKKTVTKTRIIDNPTGFLKDVQRRINKRICSHIAFPAYIIGGVKGQNPLNHPIQHIGKPVVITIDVKDCFPSITNKWVFEIWFKQLGCSAPVAHLLTKLTTRIGHVPLGAPTSNCLANLALLPCVKRAVEIAHQYNFAVPTQYIDDQAFSGYSLPDNFITLIIKEYYRQGIKINRKKIEVMWSNATQRVIGKTVNKKLSIPVSERHKVRAALHELTKMEYTNPAYLKCYRNVHGRIHNLKNFHPRLSKIMLQKLESLKNHSGGMGIKKI